MLQALRIRDFRLLWAGGTISYLGSWLLVLAVPAHVYLVTTSLAATGLTLAAEYLPLVLLGPIAGVLTDRRDRRSLLITTNLFRALAVAAMLLALVPGRYWIFYAALIAESAGTAIAVPALRALTPAVVGTGTALNSANSLNSLSNGAVRLIGGPAGGILFTVLGIRTLIVADVLSYLVAAAAITMTTRESQKPGRHHSSIRAALRELREGQRILTREPAARALLPVSVIFLTANASLTAVVVAFGISRLGGSQATGFLFAALGAGFLAGAPILKITLDRFSPKNLLSLTLALTAGSYMLLFHSSSLATALPAAVAVGLFGSMALVIMQTTIQRVIPNAALGRISAVFLTGEAAATLAGALAGPVLAQTIHLAGLAAAASLTTVLAAVLTMILMPHAHRSI
ncbi:MAG TPA: MFS transporter [Streptosporangiaceae bacterium]|nr:MFS transporter [Streptosporangiaceae bacterium]